MIPGNARFRKHKRKSRRAVPGIKPGAAVILNNSILVWNNHDQFIDYWASKGLVVDELETKE